MSGSALETAARAGLIDPGYFDALASAVCAAGLESDGRPLRISLYLAAESSTFVRFNQAQVRQASRVLQGDLTLAVVAPAPDGGARRIACTLSLCGRVDDDVAMLLHERDRAIADLACIPDDPYLLLAECSACSHRHDTGALPEPAALIRLVAQVARDAGGLDLVGHCASGAVVRAFADSRGQRHWHHVETFHFEWCVVAHGDKSVKAVYAGTHWDDAEFAQRLAEAARQLPLLARPARRLSPGAYRAYFTPTAMSGLLGVTAWSGFSEQARRTGTSSLCLLARGEAVLHPSVSLAEDALGGAAPAFTEDGHLRPPQVGLIE
eukprot:gene17384-24015_t